MRCAYPPYESRIRRCSVDALRLSTLRSPIRRCSVDALRLSTLRSPIRRCSVDALRLSTLRKPNPLLFGGCAALIHPTKAESAAVRWMRCAYPPYESRIRRCSVDALRLSTLRKPDSAAVRWMRCAYPPYESRIRRCSVDALRLSTLRKPAAVRWMPRLSTLRCSVDALRLSTLRKPNPPLFGGCAALIHPTKPDSLL
jgi:hypothetical protein